MQQLRQRIQSRTAKVGVIGLGYVGLPMAVGAGTAGYSVIGFDIDRRKIEAISAGERYIEDVDPDEWKFVIENGKLTATSDFVRLRECDVVLVCVPTPINRAKEPDMSAVEAAADSIARTLRAEQLIIVESTTYPGTTVELVQPRLEATGLRAGTDFALVFSPERIDPGNKRFKLRQVPKVVGGLTEQCTQLAIEFYSPFIDQLVPVSSPTAAEMTKIYENVFRSVNIALVNELALLCNRMGLNVWEVIDAASTKPYGFMTFYPGPGLGGHCIPVDPYYLAWKARHYDFHVKFVELSATINDSMPYYVCSRVNDALNSHFKSVNGSDVLILGVTYKRDVADLRESPALKIIEILHQRGAKVSYHDPYIPTLHVHDHVQLHLQSETLTAERLQQADCVVIVADHSSYDWGMIAENAKLIVDTRNAMKAFPLPHIWKL
ncbi:MAG: nucleotide sugar dehydrogenase [Armatimonadota bacterium]